MQKQILITNRAECLPISSQINNKNTHCIDSLSYLHKNTQILAEGVVSPNNQYGLSDPCRQICLCKRGWYRIYRVCVPFCGWCHKIKIFYGCVTIDNCWQEGHDRRILHARKYNCILSIMGLPHQGRLWLLKTDIENRDSLQQPAPWNLPHRYSPLPIKMSKVNLWMQLRRYVCVHMCISSF